ncbi:MAG: lincosamide nucleotidyltransferase [Gaiellales bacterium]|jgi:lincosamide nucleotidyltransferase A/C/D/E|nr:lincosamide nucleotidyltransferase [Gaiellales bacterium]
MDADRVLELLAHLTTNGITAWLDGGWAVDALIGRQRRPHDDVDLLVDIADAERVATVLAGHGYAVARGHAPTSFELVDAHGHQVDVHPVRFTAAGDGLYTMDSGEDWLFPAHGFAGSGEILGQTVRCLSADVMMVCHTTGYALDEVHQADVVALSERCGIPVPPIQIA